MTLVSRNLLSAKKTLPQCLSDSNSPGNQKLEQSYVSPCVRKLVRNSNQDPTAQSQEWRQDDTLSWGARKLVRRDEPSSSARARKLERGDDIQIGRTRLKFHNIQISDCRYLEKVFKNLRQKLNLTEEAPVLHLKANVLVWRLLMSTTMKASVQLGPKLQ